MLQIKGTQNKGFIIVASIAIIFGLLTIKSGGEVLFLDGTARKQAGNYVNFVVWFNFLAGFFYIIAGLGILLRKFWAIWLSSTIVALTIAVFLFFGLHIINSGLYETRTLIAMSLRTSVWLIITYFSYKKISSF